MISGIQQAVDFIANWHGITRGSDNAVDERIPRSLKIIYKAFGKLIGEKIRPGLGPFLSTNDHLTTYDSLVFDDDTFEFCFENQGIWSCRCYAQPSDSPVICNAAEMWDTDAKGYTEVCDSLDHFLTTFVLQESVLASEHIFSCAPEAAATFVDAECSSIWVDGRYIYGTPTHSFYLYAETILVMKYRGFHLASNQEVIPDSLLTTLGAKRSSGSQ